ncbi:hypothetical protein PCC7424_5315 [Gloeothece citriformis PCC 7424]|uniref:Uncharacterized protein n=1 Tax=Gloeothece citriformis (strain PCC 7424) TaxID=65393 RepID=B7KJI6_GLOC7|nr:terpene synthase family protein [Gloeothece citriformis]ACK73663.1 hypothetical protein PCC7424_5315 [Gloeothece citriformis PCC 7424]
MLKKLQVAHYINDYQQLLKQFNFSVSSKQLKVLFPLVTLIFEVDDLYDLKEASFSRSKVEDLREKMSLLLSESSLFTQPAIERFFEAMEAESHKNNRISLTEYLQISRYSIGAELLSNYMAYLLKISPEVWFSKEITHFREEIYTLIRLANDYLDDKGDQLRRENETEQIKARQFFSNLLFFKVYFYWHYALHKCHYYYYIIRTNLNRICHKENLYSRAIISAESILIWAYKVYVIDQNSIHEF